MQLASHGAAGLHSARQALYRSVNRDARRNIHYHLPNGNGNQLSATGRRILSQGRNILSKFVGHLTAPGLGSTRSAGTTSLRSAARTSIQGRLSLPVRTSLAAGGPRMFLPKVPVVPRTVAQVGLGTARNFSSARPIFQHLAENVSVKGRALQEVELDLKGRKGKENMKMRKGGKAKKAVKFEAKPMKKVGEESAAEEVKVQNELEHYFPAPIPQVTTSLHIPLAPTPTSRVPLNPQYSPSQGSFLPLPELGSIHASHEIHSMRVSSLFARLDQANVWDKGVQCSAYSHITGGGQDGVCTILKVEFEGWTKEQVRSVIGESGTGWCALEEAKATPHEFGSVKDCGTNGYDSDLSETSSIMSGIMDDESNTRYFSDSDSRSVTPPSVDPAESVVLPTIDFSSSFVNAPADAPPHSRSNSVVSDSISLSDFENFSDNGSTGSNGSGVVVDPPSLNGSNVLGFSAEFVRRAEEFRVQEENGPMESLF